MAQRSIQEPEPGSEDISPPRRSLSGAASRSARSFERLKVRAEALTGAGTEI